MGLIIGFSIVLILGLIGNYILFTAHIAGIPAEKVDIHPVFLFSAAVTWMTIITIIHMLLFHFMDKKMHKREKGE